MAEVAAPEGPYVVLVEDDHLQAEPISLALAGTVSGAQVKRIKTESAFRDALQEFRSRPPVAFVVDVMVKWGAPTRGATPQPEALAKEDFYRAGLRCAMLLFADDVLKHVPVILYTILDRSDLEGEESPLPPNASYVRKGTDVDPLVRHVRDRIAAGRRA